MHLLALFVLLVSACGSSACYVASLYSLAGEETPEIDDALLGRWRNVEEDLEIVVTRDEWRTYAVAVRTGLGAEQFTGRVVPLAGARFFDLTLPTGTESGAAQLPAHILGRVAVREDRLIVELLDYEWFRQRVARGNLGLPGVLDERETVILTALGPQWRRWFSEHAKTEALFAEAVVLAREANAGADAGAGADAEPPK